MSSYLRIKHLLFGRPIANKHAHRERLLIPLGLAIFASDNISSVAYGTEESLHVLTRYGFSDRIYHLLFPLTIAMAGLVAIVVFSYWHTIQAYPQGGGGYMVTKSNLGLGWGRVTGSAMLMDYILTVAVSISSGVGALISAVPATKPYSVPIACGALLLIAFANMRGARESGILFAVPTYAFILMVSALIVMGLAMGMGRPPIPPDFTGVEQTIIENPSGWFIALVIMRAFAGLCAALTGTEAIADGVRAFRPPEARNAGITLLIMGTTMSLLMLGVSWSTQHFGLMPMDRGDAGYQTILAQLATVVFGAGSFGFFALQFSTMLILFLAANTAFADYPRLSSFIAADGFLPRSMMSLGDRLVHQNGIIALTVVSMTLIIGFQADTHQLIPMYAVGVFTAFTLSQAAMVKHWHDLGVHDYRKGISFVGAILTGTMTLVLATTKFLEGAWLTVFAMGGIILLFNGIHRHYARVNERLLAEPKELPQSPTRTVIILLVPSLHRGIKHAIDYCKSLSHDVRAVHVVLSPERTAEVKKQWCEYGGEIPLVILDSPFRSLVEPITEYVDTAISEDPGVVVTVIVPELIPSRWWHRALHSNAAIALKAALGSRRNVVVTNVRYFLE